MCGIVAVISNQNILSTLLEGLGSLEYRGYDSSGVMILNNNSFQLVKSVGKLDSLREKLSTNNLKGNVGIGHIRWATHGKICENNAHPFCTKDVSVVLNGIIENYKSLKNDLISKGYEFISDTDAEVIPVLIQSFIDQSYSNEDSLKKTIESIRGSYAIALIFRNDDSKIFIIKNGAPIVIGFGENLSIVSSDITSMNDTINEVLYLNDKEYAEIYLNKYIVKSFSHQIVPRGTEKFENDFEMVSKGEFETFMLKEINEQSTVIKKCFDQYYDLNSKEFIFPNLYKVKSIIKDSLTIVACGSSYYAALLGKFWLEDLCEIKVDVEIASEFLYKKNIFRGESTLFISQSGETKDTLKAAELAKIEGQKIIVIVNKVNSSLARLADVVLPIYAGVEVGVASTKAFTNQLLVFYLLSRFIENQKFDFTKDYDSIINTIENALNYKIDTSIIDSIIKSKSRIFCARNILYPLALEASLKLKELSYLPAECVPFGELKHGPLALIDKDSVTITFTSEKDLLLEKNLNSIEEIKAREGNLIVVSDILFENNSVSYLKSETPNSYYTLPFSQIVPMQLIAYNVAKRLNNDVDKPRNLAKSVTVE